MVGSVEELYTAWHSLPIDWFHRRLVHATHSAHASECPDCKKCHEILYTDLKFCAFRSAYRARQNHKKGRPHRNRITESRIQA
jgi:hypothetical protein